MNSNILRLQILIIFICQPLQNAYSETGLPPLPDPLTLEAALEMVDLEHPNILYHKHAVTIANQELTLAGADNDLAISANAEAAYLDPPDRVRDLGREDHRAKIIAEKIFYDFGRTGHKQQAAQEIVESSALEFEKAIQLQRMEVMQAFLDVIIADLQYSYDNEAMAVYFIDYDRAKDRFELGQLSEIDVLQKQSVYMEIRRDRYKSQAMQRTKRVVLSDVLNRPSQVVSRFLPPALEYHKHKLIEVNKLQEVAMINNLDLVIMRKQREQAREEIKSLRANRLPTIYGKAEAGLYSRDMGSNDAWRVGVGVDIPLYQGSRLDATLAAHHERVDQFSLQIYQKEQAVKQEILALWLAIEVLVAQKQSTDIERDYRELYLDRARSLYEMEVKTNLGDSMVALTRAAKYEAETEFEIAMKWERLRYLTQMKLEDMRQ